MERKCERDERCDGSKQDLDRQMQEHAWDGKREMRIMRMRDWEKEQKLM
jgi:hypothetical protein